MQASGWYRGIIGKVQEPNFWKLRVAQQIRQVKMRRNAQTILHNDLKFEASRKFFLVLLFPTFR